jgi:putative transferase (TIGR04331 family)
MLRLQLSKFLKEETPQQELLFLSRSDSKLLLKDLIGIPQVSIVEPYGLSFDTRDSDLEKSERYYEEIIPLLASALNEIHDSQLGAREWEILLGHWLKRFIAVSVNAAGKMNLALNSFDFREVIAEHIPFGALTPVDTQNFSRLINDPHWSLAFKSRFLLLMLEDRRDKEIEWVFLGDFSQRFIQTQTIGLPSSTGLSGLRIRIQNFLSAHSQSVLSSTYLPRFNEWGLSLALKSVPQGLKFQEQIEPAVFNNEVRTKLSQLINALASEDLLLRSILRLLPEVFPIVYLENFNLASEKASKLGLPRSPKYIFTSNDFDSCELFKFWVITKINSGSKYIVGQHGNVYGTSKYFKSTVEERTSDRFITWGWNSSGKNYVQGLNLKNPSGKKTAKNLSGGFLFTQWHFPNLLTTWDSDEEYYSYLDSISVFLENLSPEVFCDLTIRLHPAKTRVNWDDEKYWNHRFPSLKIDLGSEKILSEYHKNRLVVHGYESTGLLETLSGNYPTLGFLPNGLNELRPEAQTSFSKLIDAGILHTTPESLATKLNQVAFSTENWWLSDAVQSARLEFVNIYARMSKRPIRFLLREVFSEK